MTRRPRAALAAFLVLPIVVDVALRVTGAHPAWADAGTEATLAVTALLLALTAVWGRPKAGEPGDGVALLPTDPSSEYVHFVAGIAHELNNPLMAVGGWAELALRRSEPRQSLEALVAATERATQTARRIQQLGRPAPVAASPAPPADLDDRSREAALRHRRAVPRLVLALALLAAASWVVLGVRLGDGTPALGLALRTACAAILAAAAGVRLWRQADADRRQRRDAPRQAEEAQRAGRLAALASAAAAAVADLEDDLEDVFRRARAASVIMPDKGEQMLLQARRARDIVRELSQALRLAPSDSPRPLDLAALVEQVVEAARAEGLALEVRREDLAPLPPVSGDARALSAAFLHLLRNAAQASPGGVLRIQGAQREHEVELRFVDDGPGVPAALRAQIFDPFFTSRGVGEGVGLGLTFVHFVAREHGGSIVLEDSPAGACFSLRLPALAGAQRSSSQRAATSRRIERITPSEASVDVPRVRGK